MTRTYKFDRRQLPKPGRDKWVAGLRSGDWEQIQGAMCDKHDYSSACCLHVASIEVDGNSWESGIGLGLPKKRPSFHFSHMAKNCKIEVKADGAFFCGATIFFSDINDGGMLDFNQIAELIESGKLTVEGYDITQLQASICFLS